MWFVYVIFKVFFFNPAYIEPSARQSRLRSDQSRKQVFHDSMGNSNLNPRASVVRHQEEHKWPKDFLSAVCPPLTTCYILSFDWNAYPFFEVEKSTCFPFAGGVQTFGSSFSLQTDQQQLNS